MNPFDAIIIGAGHNGLIAAAYLARAKKRVLVLERRPIVGGACVTEEVWPGYRVSTAAYLCSLLRPEIVADLKLTDHGFEVYRRETSGFAPTHHGEPLFFYPDEARMRPELERFCAQTPEDVAAYFEFEADVEKVAAVVDPFLMRVPPSEAELRAAFEAAGIASLYAPFMHGSVRDLLEPRFRNERLKTMLATDGLIGTYGGPSTPGTAYVLLHHYLGNILGSRSGWGYVRGGMGQITQALAKAVNAFGGEIRTSAEVERILIQDGHAIGVRLTDGTEIHAEALLSNADPYHTFAKLTAGAIPDDTDAPWKALVTQGGASAKINLAVSELPVFTCLPNGPIPGPEHLGTIHLGPDMAYLEHAWEEAGRGYPSTEPMIEMYVQTATDASLTPPGKHILSLFVQYFPYNLAPGLDLDTEREKFADRVIAQVAQYAPNVPASILHRQILTPRDLEARFGLTGGHIFHGDLLPPNLWTQRPGAGFLGAKTPLPGLYLCGSGAHPGGCVCGAPGYNAAQTLLSQS